MPATPQGAGLFGLQGSPPSWAEDAGLSARTKGEDMGTETLAVIGESGPPQVYLDISHAPAQVLAEARDAARALQDVLTSKPKKVVMNGEQYLEFEDWQTLGRFYGITPKVDGDPEFSDFGSIRGFKASAVALYKGEVISRATAYCLTDEEKWRSRSVYEWHYVLRDGSTQKEDPGQDHIVWEPKRNGEGNAPKKARVLVGEEPVPLFQLASMAQTRACAKVMRQVLAWVVVMAGYRATPAEELDAQSHVVDAEVVVPPPRPAAPTPKPAQAVPQPAQQAAPQTNGRGKPACPRCKRTDATITDRYKGGWTCWKNSKPRPGCGYHWDDEDQHIHESAAGERAASGDDFQVSDDDVPF